MAIFIRRREFISAARRCGGSVADRRAGQKRRIPVIGFISSISLEELAEPVAGFHRGLGEAGYVEDRNVAIEYRWARGNNDRLPEFAADLVRRRVDVIATPGSPPATLAAKTATTTIPIVFYVAAYPVALGWVAGLNSGRAATSRAWPRWVWSLAQNGSSCYMSWFPRRP